MNFKPHTRVDFTEELMHSEFYMGCGSSVDDKNQLNQLKRLVVDPDIYAEPKCDGIWCIVFWGQDGKARVFSRNRKEKSIPAFDGKMPAGTAIAGELSYGTQNGKMRRKRLGHDFMDAFDILFYDYQWLGYKTSYTRKQNLIVAVRMSSLGHCADCKEYVQILPTFSMGFEAMEALGVEHEGLILKSKNAGIYVPGTRSTSWVKYKKKHTWDMVLMGWKPSKAVTKVAKGNLAESLILGQYFRCSRTSIKRDLQRVSERLKDFHGVCLLNWWQSENLLLEDPEHDEYYILWPVTRVGSMSHEWAARVGDNFDALKGSVMVVSGYDQFKSGAIRHSSLGDRDGNVLREDKEPYECVFSLVEA